jgi:hypothetical protein
LWPTVAVPFLRRPRGFSPATRVIDATTSRMWTMPRGIVERLVIDRHAAVAGFLEQLQQFAERGLLVDRVDLGARDHHVLDAHLAQAEDVVQHRALARRDRLIPDTVAFQRVLQVFANRRGRMRPEKE